jgi:hypothetical protein
LRHLFELPSKEKENYLKDFTHQMAARGLHIDYVAKLRTWKRLRRGKRGNPR